MTHWKCHGFRQGVTYSESNERFAHAQQEPETYQQDHMWFNALRVSVLGRPHETPRGSTYAIITKCSYRRIPSLVLTLSVKDSYPQPLIDTGSIYELYEIDDAQEVVVGNIHLLAPLITICETRSCRQILSKCNVGVYRQCPQQACLCHANSRCHPNFTWQVFVSAVDIDRDDVCYLVWTTIAQPAVLGHGLIL